MPQKTFQFQANGESWSSYFMPQYLGINFLKSLEKRL